MKYSEFFEVARRTEGFADLQNFFVNYTGLKDIILKLELMKNEKVADSELETDLRKQYMVGLEADIAKIDKVSQQLIEKLDASFAKITSTPKPPKPTQLGMAKESTGDTPPFDVETPTAMTEQSSPLDVLYVKARLVKQYCELNSEAVRKIAKKYDKRAGGSNEQERRISELKTRALGDGRISRTIDRIEKELVEEGKLSPDQETTMLCAKEGVHINSANAKDVGIVEKFLRLMLTVVVHGPDDVALATGLLSARQASPEQAQPEDKKSDQIDAKQAVDKWALKEMKTSGKPWSEKTTAERIVTVGMTISKLLLVAGLLYLFIISLSLMGNAFKVLGGKTSGKAFRQSELFSNPVAGIVIGILATVLVQSSSTSTSIIITMAAADLISMKNSVPMIMGANIGTSVTASIVSVAHIGDKDQYRRAFGGAIVHYCFNVLTVVILLPLEVMTGMLEHISSAIVVDGMGITNDDENLGKQDFLKKITKPISSRLLQVDKKLVTKIAEEADPIKLAALEKQSIIVQSQSKDNHLFMDTPMSDTAAGVLLIIVSLLFLSIVLMLLVKTLQSVFKGRAAILMGKLLNLEFKSCPLAADYVLMVFGIGLTILMQSSSVTTSALTPLVGIGLIRVEKMFPFTIGANIGTTVTGVLAALASSNMVIGMQVAMTHLLFNVFGTLMWFMVPKMRQAPLSMAKFLGSLAAEVKLFPIALILFAWVLMPGFLLLLCIGGVAVTAVIGSLMSFAFLALIALIWMRSYYPEKLPAGLRQNRSWLPPTLCVADKDGRQPSFHNVPVGAAAGALGLDDEPVDADSLSSGWWQSPLAWGSGWFILMMLVVALPNCQWANLKYPKFDGRDHVGIGSWQACSAMYESQQDWAPPRAACSSSDLQACATIKGCSEGAFSDVPDANKNYEKSWLACREKCSPQEWGKHCLGMACGGSLHEKQCNNVTTGVHQDYQVSYKSISEPAWLAGDRCRDVSELCDNGAKLGQAGSFGWSAFACVSVAQMLLIAYRSVMSKKASKLKVLAASLGSFFLAWICLILAWAIFSTAVNDKATCIVMDASGSGAVVASGNFGDIINANGSYTYGCIVGSWALTTLVVGVIGHHLCTEVAKKKRDIAMKTAAI